MMLKAKKVSAPKMPVQTAAKEMREMPMSVASIGRPSNEGVKTTGIKIRGTGAATKGTTARGPMA